MAVSAASNKTIALGDATTDDFEFDFALPSDSDGSDVDVYIVDNLGNVTLLTSNYTVNTGTSIVHYPVTGHVAPLTDYDKVPAGWQVVMVRVEALAQNLQLTNQGLFSLPAIESALDYLMFIAQQMQEQLNRCIMVPVNTPNTDAGPVITPSTTVLPFYGAAGNLTYSQIKALAALAPTQQAWGWASDLNAGQGQLLFYCASLTVGDGGWLAMPVGFIGG